MIRKNFNNTDNGILNLEFQKIMNLAAVLKWLNFAVAPCYDGATYLYTKNLYRKYRRDRPSRVAVCAPPNSKVLTRLFCKANIGWARELCL